VSGLIDLEEDPTDATDPCGHPLVSEVPARRWSDTGRVDLHPVLLLNDGSSLTPARITPDGRVEKPVSWPGIPITAPTDGRFFSGIEMVVNQDRRGLRLSSAGLTPALPPLPDEIERRWAEVLPENRGALYFKVGDHLFLCEDGQWRRHNVPIAIDTHAVIYDQGWLAAGSRGVQPVLFDPETLAEIDVPWQRRRRSVHVSDGTFVSLRTSRVGLVAQHDDGLLERSVTHVYLRQGGRWTWRYVGDDRTAAVFDPDGKLPPILLSTGRWLEPATDRLDFAVPLALGADAISLGLTNDPQDPKGKWVGNAAWRYVSVLSDVVTALVYLFRGSGGGLAVALQGQVGYPLNVVAQWPDGGERPVDMTTADTSVFEWL
jgi:hypothetical protein